MSINWDIVHELGKKEAEAYANARGYEAGSVHWTNQYNAFFHGYLKNAGERESLRVINERLEKNLIIKESEQIVVRGALDVPTLSGPIKLVEAAPSMLGSFM